jgi:hypothetical protein
MFNVNCQAKCVIESVFLIALQHLSQPCPAENEPAGSCTFLLNSKFPTPSTGIFSLMNFLRHDSLKLVDLLSQTCACVSFVLLCVSSFRVVKNNVFSVFRVGEQGPCFVIVSIKQGLLLRSCEALH